MFAQSAPVPPEAFPVRLAGAAAGGAAVAAVTVIKWYWQGHGKDGRGLKEQIRLCTVRKGYILRMSMGIAAAMFIGMVLHLRLSLIHIFLQQPDKILLRCPLMQKQREIQVAGHIQDIRKTFLLVFPGRKHPVIRCV